MVVEYGLDFKPLRKYVGLQKPVDITPLADGTILLVDEDARQVMVFDTNGTVRWSEQIGDHPTRARPRPGGGLLVTSGEQVIALRADRTVEWTLRVDGIRAAVPLANGNILTTTNAAGNGWLTELTPDGTVVWRSKPRGWVDASGHWVDEAPDQYFHSVWSLDVADNGNVFLTDFDGGRLRLLSPTYQNLRVIPGLHHVTDTRVGPAGELIAVSPEDFVVWLAPPDGIIKTLQPEMRPLCANISAARTLLVGLLWEPERAVLNATVLRSKDRPSLPWHQRALPVSILGAVSGVVVALMLRRRELRGARSHSEPPGSQAEPAHNNSGGPAVPASSSPQTRSHSVVSAGTAALCVTALGFGSYLAWSGMGRVESGGVANGFGRFAFGCILAGAALRLMNTMVGCAATLSSFAPSEWHAPGHSRSLGRGVLIVLAMASLAACIGVLRYFRTEEAIAIGLWLSAQIWIIAAAFPAEPPSSSERAPAYVWALLGVLLLGAIVTRFWQIGYYPDYVHHDHSIYGQAALRTLRGEWKPFFLRVYSVGRPWLAVCAAGLMLFGRHYWVLRLTGAIGGVVLVWGAYLLGAVLFNRRIGLIAALLVMVNNVLLLYSRQPYVLDPVAPFVLAMYCAAIGLKRGCRLRWCLSGVLGGWTLLAYHSSVVFVPVAAAMFLCLACLCPRPLWRNRGGLLWLIAGACIVCLPTFVQAAGDPTTVQRANSLVVFLNPNGSIRWDASLWAHQLGRSFGAIIYYADSAPWGISTGRSIAMRYGSCLFGIGLAYLLTSLRAPATLLVLAWTIIYIFLGCATLPDPPTYYHLLGAIVPIMFVSGVALDRTLALTDRWRPAFWRVPPLCAALVLLAALSAAQLNAVWLAVRRPPSLAGGQTVFRANPGVTAARFIREHPRYRYYLVRSRMDITSDNPLFNFFADDSDMSDLSGDITGALPVPPVDPAMGVGFVVLPSRAGARDVIAAVYPGGTGEELASSANDVVWIYLADAETVRRVYDLSHSRPEPGATTFLCSKGFSERPPPNGRESPL